MGQSIPLVCQDWANTKAAYRFFSNDRVSEADILTGHFFSNRRVIVPPPLKVSFLCCMIQPNSAINARSQKRSQIAHGLRHPDAFQPRRYNRGGAAGVGGR
ncbi:hypothetical protein ACVWZL_009140 [Bradyrhizobium sp. GM2.4]